MRLYHSYCDMPLLIVALTAGLIGAGPAARAATVLWDGGAGANMSWTADGPGGNWSGSAVPGAADTAAFTHVAGGAAHGALTNVVPSAYTAAALSYQLDPATPTAFFHTTEIAAGGTLLLTGGLNVSPSSVGAAGDVRTGQSFVVDVAVVGSGSTLQVGDTGTHTANMIIGRSASAGSHNTYSSHSFGKLDLSGLSYFEANLNTLSLGHGIEWGSAGVGRLTLAANNLISATRIETGRGTGQATILLGQENTIRTDTFYLNIGKGNPGNWPSVGSDVRFQNGLTNPVLNLTGLNNAGVNLAISYNHTNSTAASNVDVMDLTGGVFNATINELTLGRFAGSHNGGSRGTLIMDAGTVTASRITMAETTGPVPENTQGTLTMRGGSFTVFGPITDGGGTSTINVHGGTFTSYGTIGLDNLNLGTSTATATLAINGLASGDREVTNYNHGANGVLALTVNPFGSGAIHATTATLANGSRVEVNAIDGVSTSAADQTRWIAGTGAWDATDSPWSEGLPAGFTIANNTAYQFLQAGTLTNNGLSLTNSPGWNLSVTPGANGTATVTRTGGDLTTGPRRAVIDDSAANVTRADHLTVAEAAGADAAMLEVKAGQLTVGTAGDPKNLTLGSGAAPGQLLQSGGTLLVHGNVASTGPSTVNLYGGTLNVDGSFQVDNLAVGKENGSAVLRLDSTDAVTHTIGNSVTLADGVGSSGTIRVLSGTLTVSGGISGGGASALHIDGGGLDHDAGDPIGTSPASVTINGDLKVDELRVGYMHNEGGTILGGKATLTVVGGDVEVGDGTRTLNIGRRVHSVSAHPQPDRYWGIADFSAATSVTVDVEALWLGVSRTPTGGNPSPGPNTVGELYLSTSGPNIIRAAEILAGDVPGGAGASPDDSSITFGASTNDVLTDLLILGGRKGRGVASLADGGELNIGGLTGSEAHLMIANNDVGTDSSSTGALDVSGGTLNATFHEVVLGRFTGSGNGSGRATFIMGNGSVTANSLRLAESDSTNNAAATYGILQMVHDDGLFTVSGDITDGRGAGHLRIDAGSLVVGGSMNVDNLRVGQGVGTALLNLTGMAGTHSVGSAVTIAGGAGSNGTIRIAGGTFDLPALTDGGGTSTLDLPNGTMNVAGNFAVDNVWVGANDGTAVLNVGGTVAIGSGAGSTLNVAVVAAGGTGGGSGTLNFANATSVAIDVDTVRIANSGHGAGSTGLVQLSGGANTIRAEEVVIGNRKGIATVDMVAGGTLDIVGQTGARANMSIGRNN
ncbi:MAG: hypothetical protein RBS80_12250, partial [Thermoguttaceae bacterium]|nr:hypothetical protein [Thermoguttaceae bacterium]